MALATIDLNRPALLEKPVNRRRNLKRKMPTLGASLREANTIIFSDTLDFTNVSFNDPEGTSLSPSALLSGLAVEHIQYHLWVATKLALEDFRNTRTKAPTLLAAIFERLVVEIGKVLVDRSPEGFHFTFIDTRLHDDAPAMSSSARRIISLFEEAGVPRRSVIISIPATEAGILAANHLERKYHIKTNMVYVSGISHAAACAEAHVTSVSLPVGPILGWYEKKRKAMYFDIKTHPGMEVIQATLAYFTLHDMETKVLGTSLRAMEEIGPLGCLDGLFLNNVALDDLRRPLSFHLTKEIPQTSPAYARAEAIPLKPLLRKDYKLRDHLDMDARDMLTGVTHHELGRMKSKMGFIDDLITIEATRQYKQAKLGLARQYAISSSPAPKRNARKQKEDRDLNAVKTHEESPKERCSTPEPGDVRAHPVEGLDYF